MSDDEKRARAEQFIAEAVKEMGGTVDADSYELAVQRAAAALPPYALEEDC